MPRKPRKPKARNRKTFHVSWTEWHSADLEAASPAEVSQHFWELIEALGDHHPHLTFEDWQITKVQERRDPS